MLRRMRWWWRRAQQERDLQEELQAHLAIEAKLQRDAGASAGEAERAARQAFGNLTRVKEEVRDVWRIAWLEDLCQDLRHGARVLRHHPGFAAVTTLTLALGIGAATAVFSIVDAVLLRPLPYQNPERLVAIWGRGVHDPNIPKIFLDYATYEHFQHKSKTLESISAATWAGGMASHILSGNGTTPAKPVLAIPVTSSFFQTLGVHAKIGRTFLPEDEHLGCAAVLSHGFWNDTFGAREDLVGESVTLDERACTVTGVMPESFHFFPRRTQAWLLMKPQFRAMGTGLFARLKPGVTYAQAQDELSRIHRESAPGGLWRNVEPAVHDLHGEFTFLASRTLRSTLAVTSAAVALVLLTACVNLASLLMARLSGRQRELALRAALGSSTSRLIRQILAETLLLASAGAASGIALAFGFVRYFEWTNPIELSTAVTLHPRVMLFAVAVSASTAVLFGLLPAIRASRMDVIERLKTAGRGALPTASHTATVRIGVAMQLALSFILMIVAALLLSSVLRMGGVDLGFNPNRLLAASIQLPESRYSTEAKRAEFYQRLEEGLQSVHGVVRVTLASKVPPDSGGNQELQILDRPTEAGSGPHHVGADAISPGFFDVLRIPLRRGRLFDVRDRLHSEPVAIVNQALADEYFAGTDPLGKQIRLADGASRMPWLTIVGVVGNTKHTELMNEMRWVETPMLYRPVTQEPRRSMEIVIAAAAEDGSLKQDVARYVASIDANVPMRELEPLVSRISRLLAYARFRAAVLGVFALSTLFLSAVGLHGLLSQLVASRMVEFAVRRAVGAQSVDILRMVVRLSSTPVVLGMTAGVVGTLISNRLIEGFLYGVRPAEPSVLAGVATVLLAAAVLAIAVPAMKALRIDPITALRNE
ncbi:MAG: ABC transporter permease [Bryobacterales bacterium]|nr:ABC transporter permease [Bryobacterales bacterium]